MKLSTKLISAAVLLATTSMALAATDSTIINLQVTKGAYVEFTGSLSVSGQTRDLPAGVLGVDGIPAASTVIGDLGMKSNTTGLCNLSITSDNLFNLKDGSVELYPSKYTVDYAGTNFNNGFTALTGTAGLSCNTLASDVTVNTPEVIGVVAQGIYTDILRINIATQ